MEQPHTTAPALERPAGLSSGLRKVILAGSLIAILLIAVLGYAGIGFALAQSRISNADRTLNTVISHQNRLNSTFHAIDAKFATLESGSAFNPTTATGVILEFIANSQEAGRTVDQDDASLASAAGGLNDLQWLTAISRGNLNRELKRVGHARAALAAARTVAADYVLDGQFLQSFMQSIIDLDTLGNQTLAGDFNGAKTTLATMKTDVDKATELSSAPGLPSDLHALMVDFQTLVTDSGKLIDAALASDDAGVTSYEQALQSDGSKISGYNFDKISTQIDAYYKPLVDGFNSEMAAATA